MTVSSQLLAELVSAYESQQKLSKLTRELISVVLKSSGPAHSQAFRYGEYNITVNPSPFRTTLHVSILRAKDLTPEPAGAACDTVKEELRPGALHFTNLSAGEGAEVPGNVQLSEVEREALINAHDALVFTPFAWNQSKAGRKFWVGLTNPLRKALGYEVLS